MNECELIAEEDEEFGSVVEVPLKKEERKKERLSIEAEQINHLSTEQQGHLLTILNKYQDRFTEKTGLCTLVEHEIKLKPDFRVKEFAAYRIPFAYRSEGGKTTSGYASTRDYQIIYKSNGKSSYHCQEEGRITTISV